MKVKYEGKRKNLSVLGIGAFPIDIEVEIKDKDWNRIKSIEGMKQINKVIIPKFKLPKGQKKVGGDE